MVGQTLRPTSNGGNTRQQQQHSPPSSVSLPRKMTLRRRFNNSQRAEDAAVPPPRYYNKPAQRHQSKRLVEIDEASIWPSSKKQKSVRALPALTVVTDITRRPSMDRNRFVNKKRIVVPDNQRSTKNLSLVDDIISSSSTTTRNITKQMNQTAAAATAQLKAQRPTSGYFGSSSYHTINLRTRVYTPLNVFKAHIGGKHLGSVCEPVPEAMLIHRNSKQIGKWQNIDCPPPYFTRAEVDAEISQGENSEYYFMRKAACYCLSKHIKNIIRNFGKIQTECYTALKNSYNQRKSESIPENWWPVGYKGGLKRQGYFVNTKPLVNCCNNYNPHGDCIDIRWMARGCSSQTNTLWDGR